MGDLGFKERQSDPRTCIFNHLYTQSPNVGMTVSGERDDAQLSPAWFHLRKQGRSWGEPDGVYLVRGRESTVKPDPPPPPWGCVPMHIKGFALLQCTIHSNSNSCMIFKFTFPYNIQLSLHFLLSWSLMLFAEMEKLFFSLLPFLICLFTSGLK